MAQEALKIFCDFDGTLVDVSMRHYAVYDELIQKYGGKALSKNAYWELKRQKTRWPELLVASDVSLESLHPFLEDFIKKIEHPDYLAMDTLFPGAIATLDVLQKKGECSLVSLRRNRQNLLDEIARLGLQGHFSKVLSGHSESDGYDVKIAHIKKELAGCEGVIIGDTEADVVTGKELGLTTIGLTSGFRDERFLRALEPDYLLASIADVPLTVPLFGE